MQRKRNIARFELPNGCNCSRLNVTPQNWETENASLDGVWFISYRFYDALGRCKQVQLRGMNYFDELKSRQKATKEILDREWHLLTNEGYNPFTGDCTPPPPDTEDDLDYEIHPNTPLPRALQLALDHFEGESRPDLKSSLKYISMSIRMLKYDQWAVKDVKSRHLLRILNNCKNIKGKKWSNNQFNHYRSALISLYKILKTYETVEYNPIHNIPKKEHLAKPRQILSQAQREAIDKRLKIENYRFWNFIHLFFHSGARLTEMARVQGKHVNLERQEVLYQVKKGKSWAWISRPIADEAIPFWRRALINCGPKQYVFSKNLLPGDKPIRPEQYTRRWKRWIKDPVADENKKHDPRNKRERINWMDVDLYELKHTHTTELMDILDGQMDKDSLKLAATANGHTTGKMVEMVYDLKNKARKNEKLKSIPIKFS